MGHVLDSVRSDMYGSRDDDGTTNYVTINTSDTTSGFDVSGSEGGHVIQLTYANGAGNDFDFTLDFSIDGVSWASVSETAQNVADASGVIMWDMIGTGTNFVRVSWTANSGSMDIYLQLSEKRRH
jgi:hypothetical protein